MSNWFNKRTSPEVLLGQKATSSKDINILNLANPRKDVKYAKVQPYLITSLVSWPTFFLYRGLNWCKKPKSIQMIKYIKRTYFQAKLIQLGIVALGFAPYMEAPLKKIRDVQYVSSNTNFDTVAKTCGLIDE